MIRLSRFAMSAVAGAVLLAGASTAASAHVGGGHGFGGGGHFGHGHGFRGGYFIGFDDGYDGYDGYGYGGGCSYLRHKAHETGRPYWWRRYEACLDG